MKKRMGQIRLGMFLLTLMILGFSYKGSYGNIPVKSKDPAQQKTNKFQ